MSLRLGEEVQALMRRGDGELTRNPDSSNGSVPTPECDNYGARGLVMEQAGIQGLCHRRSVMRAQGRRILGGVLRRGTEADGVMETEFYLPDTFRKQESAIEAAIQSGRQKIDMGFERGLAALNG